MRKTGLSRSLAGILVALLACWVFAAHATIPASERAVLINLYMSTGGASWTVRTNWNGAVGTECRWYGVLCDSTQDHVTTIHLEANNLTGTLPPISGLTRLQAFHIVNNPNLSGSLPSLSGMTSLRRVWISQTGITGPIPALSGLSALQAFVAPYNRLSGTIPALTGLTALQEFFVPYNRLSGSIPALTGLTALQRFDAYNNQLSGPIPSLTGLTSLQRLDVSNNQLTGSLPSLAGLGALQVLDVAGNPQMSGPIPSLTGLASLRFFQASDSGLTGSIPSLAGLTALQGFNVAGNQLSGPVPTPPASLAAGSSYLCGNRLVSSGVPSIDAAWTTAAGNWLGCQAASSPPTCTLRATPNTFPSGTATTVSLVATCTSSPTRHSWSSPAGAPVVVGTGGTVTASFLATTAAGTYTYSVTATNGAGTSTPATATVTVTMAAQPPRCTVTASPSTFASGRATTVSLTASCTNSPTSYSWSAPAGAPAVTGTGSSVTVSFPASTAAGSYVYSLNATNAAGTGVASVQIIATSIPKPACTLTASPNPIAAGSPATVTLVATCTNSPTSYIWSASPGAPPVIGSGGTVTAAFLLVTPAGTFTYSVQGVNAGGAGPAASTTVTVDAPLAPVCTLNAPSYFVAGQPPVTLSASCNPSATSYVWTGGACANATGPSCAVSPSETTTYTVAGRNAGGVGPADSKIVLVSMPLFGMTVSSSVTATTATASVQIQPRPQDAGSNANVFVFAHVPASLLGPAPSAGEPSEKAGSPNPCVLAQLNANGQVAPVTPATMRAHSTLSSSQTVTVLNNVPVATVAGASFFVGYGTNASAMFGNGTYQAALSIPGASQCTAVPLAGAAPSSPGGLSGLWWNSREPGWGIQFTQRRNILFVAWYTYDSAGNPKWYVASSCAMPPGTSGTSGICSGTLYEVSGPTFFGTRFNAGAVNLMTAGSLQVNFQNADNASMTYSLNGQGRTVALTRQMFASGPMPPAVDYSDLWWSPDESGWGLALTHQYGVMFLAWYVYDGAGRPVWYVASNCVVSGSNCSGDLYRTTGPPFGPSFDPTRVQAFVAGVVGLSFIDANNATLTYTVNGVRAVKLITRQVF